MSQTHLTGAHSKGGAWQAPVQGQEEEGMVPLIVGEMKKKKKSHKITGLENEKAK